MEGDGREARLIPRRRGKGGQGKRGGTGGEGTDEGAGDLMREGRGRKCAKGGWRTRWGERERGRAGEGEREMVKGERRRRKGEGEGKEKTAKERWQRSDGKSERMRVRG